MIKLGTTEITLPGIDSGYVGTNLVYSSYAYDTITGVSPLFLANSFNKSLRSLTQYGKCEQRNLPQGYTQVEYIASNGTDGNVNTGIVLNTIDLNVEVDFQYSGTPSAASPSMVWGYMGSASNLPRWGMGAYSSKWLGSVNQTLIASSFDTDRHKAVLRTFMDGENPMWDGTLDGTELYVAASLPSPSTFTDNTLPVMLFARNNSGTAGNFAPAKIYAFEVRKAGVLVNNLVPCKCGTTPGFYDTVTGNFLTGTGLSAGPDLVPIPAVPMDIYCNNGVLRYGPVGKNLFGATIEQGNIASATGQDTTATSRCRSVGYIPVKPNTTYTISAEISNYNPGSSRGVFIYSYNEDASVWFISNWQNANGYTFTTTAETVKIRVVFASTASGTVLPADINNVQLELGSTATAYEPFRTGIYADGTPETLTICGKNEANVEDYTESFTNRRFVPKAIGVTLEAGVTYTFSCDVECSVTPFDISIGVGRGGTYSKDIVTERNRTNGRNSVTFTPTAETLADYTELYVRIPRFVETQTGTVSVSKIQLERGSTATEFEPYVTPQTVANIPDLFAVGADYADEVDLVSGLLTHKVGIYVFTGAETDAWTVQNNRVYTMKTNIGMSNAKNDTKILCTISAQALTAVNVYGNVLIYANWGSLGIDTVEKFNAYLAANPVIVIYPLAEPTTEQTTAYALHSYKGSTIIDTVSAVNPITLSAEYAKKGG